MSVKIRISYTTDEELAGVIRLLSPVIKSYKVSRKREGKYRNAYADLDVFSLMKHKLKTERTKSEA